jgi:hypothetical protein
MGNYMRLSSGSTARFGLIALGTLGLLIGSATAVTAAPAGQPRWHVSTVDAPVPSSRAGFNEVACSDSADCVAVGNYESKADPSVAGQMVASESAGIWSAAQPLPNPAGSLPWQAGVEGLACPATGNCAAVGSYYAVDTGFSWPYTISELAGSWGAATQVDPPENHSPNPYADLTGVSCPAVGQCVAVGPYNATEHHKPSAMVATESGGSWHQAVQISLPQNASRNPHIGGELEAVACTGVGSCVAIGSYTTRSPGRVLPMAAMESHGRWGRARALPARAAGLFFSISCLADGECVLVGTNGVTAASQRAIAVTERHGIWGRSVRIGTSGTGAARPMGSGDSVGCGTTSCVVIGAGYHGQSLVVSFTGGKWTRYSVIPPPASAGPKAVLGFGRVACTGASACTTVGSLQLKGNVDQPAVASRP